VQPAGSSRWQEIGDPTEAALIVVALKAKLNLDELRQHSNRLHEIPFDSRRKMMTVVLNWNSPNCGKNKLPIFALPREQP
jgi:magnesium-transporting ATPase (P-type)